MNTTNTAPTPGRRLNSLEWALLLCTTATVIAGGLYYFYPEFYNTMLGDDSFRYIAGTLLIFDAILIARALGTYIDSRQSRRPKRNSPQHPCGW